MQFLELLVEPKFASESEREYTESMTSQWEHSISRIFLKLNALAWFPIVVFSSLQMIEPTESYILIAYSVMQCAWCLWILSKDHPAQVWQKQIFWMLLVSQVFWTTAAFVDTSDGVGSKALVRTWILYSMLGNIFLPLQSRFHQIILFVTIPTTILAIMRYPHPWIGLILSFFALVGGQNCQIFARRLIKVDAIRTFRDQSKYIPRQVLMKAARTSKNILDVFRPSERFCVCVSSDWRHFQSLLDEDALGTVGQNVVRYYEHVVGLLYQKFPEGQFFVDWIADEMFIVIFGESVVSDPLIAKNAFELTTEIMAYRAVFSAQYGYPSGIDIGLSAGIASVGIFGHGGIAKATAFSATPGIARRLQEVAKRLGALHGLEERVVMSAEFSELLGETRTRFTELILGDAFKVKDLESASVYVWPKIDSLIGQNSVPVVDVSAA